MSTVQGQVVASVPTVRASGNPNLLQMQLGELGVTELLPRYTALAWSGKVFTAYSTARATTVVGTAMVGLQLYNGSPITGSGSVNLVLLNVGGTITVTSATQTGVLLASGTGQVSAPTSQTAIDRSANNLIGGPSPAALATAAGTFTNAPTSFMILEHNTAAIAVTGEDNGYFWDLSGSIVVPTQSYVAFAALGATGAASSNHHHIMWAEIPV